MPPLQLVTLSEVKEQLNIPAGPSSDDTELQRWLPSVVEGIDFRCGPTDPRQITERCAGDSDRLVVSTFAGGPVTGTAGPVLTVQSVSALLIGAATFVDVSTLDVDPSTGVIYRTDGGWFIGPQRVVYTAGRAAVPPSLKQAALIIIEHLWDTQRGAGIAPGTGGDDDDVAVAGFAYAVPNRAVELMEPYLLPAGVA